MPDSHYLEEGVILDLTKLKQDQNVPLPGSLFGGREDRLSSNQRRNTKGPIFVGSGDVPQVVGNEYVR